MALTPTEQETIAKLIFRLMDAPVSPADLTFSEATYLGESLLDFARHFPEVAERAANYVSYTAYVLGVRDIKNGHSGTCAQNTERHRPQVEHLIALRHTK